MKHQEAPCEFDVSEVNHISRRRFIQYGSAVLVGTGFCPVFAQQQNYDVIVIGAGLAGLQMTRLLQRHGMDVVLLEAGNRVGGRIHTLDNLERKPEAGGTLTGTGYANLNAVAEELNVKFRPVQAGTPGMSLSVNGELMAASDWQSSEFNQAPEKFRALHPDRYLANLLLQGEQITRPLDWNNQENAHLDITLASYLKKLGANEEMLRLIDANINGVSVHTISAADVLRKSSVFINSGIPQLIKGGSQRLPDAMHASLKSPPQMQKSVIKIHDSGNQIIVSCADGSRFKAKRCVISLPFSVLRKIKIDAPL